MAVETLEHFSLKTVVTFVNVEERNLSRLGNLCIENEIVWALSSFRNAIEVRAASVLRVCRKNFRTNNG